MTKNILVWWLNQKEIEAINKMELDLPAYIDNEMIRKFKAVGKRRFFIPNEIDCVQTNWNPKNPICKLITLSSAGGIVFHATDFDKVKELPGFITDINLNWCHKGLGYLLYKKKKTEEMELKETESIRTLEQRNFYRSLKHAIDLMGGRIDSFEHDSFKEIELKLRQNGINLSFSFDNEIMYKRHFD